MGRVYGHAVRFGRPADGASLLVGEGIKTVLSVVTAVPDITAAALSVGSLGAFRASARHRAAHHRARQRRGREAGSGTPHPALRAGLRRRHRHRPRGRRFQRRPRCTRFARARRAARAPVSPARPGAGVMSLSGRRHSGRGSGAAINWGNRHVPCHPPARRRRRRPGSLLRHAVPRRCRLRRPSGPATPLAARRITISYRNHWKIRLAAAPALAHVTP